MEKTIRKFVASKWFPQHGSHLVAEEDLESFTKLMPADKVFEYLGENQGWAVLRYGGKVYRVNPTTFNPVTAPKFEVGQSVKAISKDQLAKILYVAWHYKNATHVYGLAFDGKKSSRRYLESEIESV